MLTSVSYYLKVSELDSSSNRRFFKYIAQLLINSIVVRLIIVLVDVLRMSR